MRKKLLYNTSINKKLCGILSVSNVSKEVVVICHARYSSKDSRVTFLISEYLTDNNVNNFRFDFVSCGESEGNYMDYTITSMINNLHDTLDILNNNYGFTSFILIGCSLGGRIVSLVDKEKYDIKKIILWYPALNYKRFRKIPSKDEKLAKKIGYTIIEHNNKLSYDYYLDNKKYNVFKNLKKIDIPILFIHGKSDSFVSFKCSRSICKRCNNSKLVLIDNGDHGFHDEICMNKALKETLKFIN